MDRSLQFLADGLLGAGAWTIVAYTLLTTHLTIVAVTIYLHRCQAHRALELHPIVSHVFRFWLWISTGMVTREWVAVHRKHHACCEKDGDPHSPQLVGIRKVLLEGTELYRTETGNASTVERFGQGTPDDWLERKVYATCPWQGVALLLLADLAMFGAIGATVWAVQMLWIPVTAAGIINGLGHYRGYRNFDGPHAAANILPWGILIGGEELHNNHHTFPASARLSARWFELDIGWCYIRLLQCLGLARVRTLPPRPARRGRTGYTATPLSIATVIGINACRHHVMRDYGLMLAHTLRTELRQAGCRTSLRFRRQAERLLRREPDYLGVGQRAELELLLGTYQPLARMQAMRRELRQLWEAKSASPQELLDHLSDWCERAERSGLAPLLGFARRLRHYG
jgi:stearoyl-CoA desaturase (delta-9 desaturase)